MSVAEHAYPSRKQRRIRLTTDGRQGTSGQGRKGVKLGSGTGTEAEQALEISTSSNAWSKGGRAIY
eukprot:5682192-Heterocapsa_arctica.AAC.1